MTCPTRNIFHSHGARLLRLLLLPLLFALPVFAQSVDRAALLREIIELKAQVDATTDPAEKNRLTQLARPKENQFLAPSAEDVTANASFLKQPNTGLCRLMPRENFGSVLVMNGGGAYYSFVTQDHPYGYGNDLQLQRNEFSVGFAGADFGFLTRLGNVPIETANQDSPGVQWLGAYIPPLDEPGARVEQQRAFTGFMQGPFSYKRNLPVEIGVTYALRSISYHTNDLLVIFHPFRRDTDGSVLLAWKLLIRYPTPQLRGATTILTTAAATYLPTNYAPGTIAVAFGKNFAGGDFLADRIPLPSELGGTYVTLQTEGGNPYAPLFAVTPNQINFMIPSTAAEGYGLISIRTAAGESYRERIRIAKVAPGLFSANADGKGVVAGVLLRVRGGQQIYEPLARFDGAQNKFVPLPIDLGNAGEQVFLLLYGSGIRGRSDLSKVRVTIGGVEILPTYAGEQGLPGLDQINVPLPASLVGKGEVDLTLTADGQASNVVRLSVK